MEKTTGYHCGCGKIHKHSEICPEIIFERDFKEKVQEKAEEFMLNKCPIKYPHDPRLVKLSKWAYDMGKEG